MKISKLLTSAAVAAMLSGFLYGAPFEVDIEHSNVGFKIKHLMISNVKGHFSKFSGTYDLDNGVLKSLNGTIETASIDTGIEKRDNHLRSADFFEVEKYPQITFKMTSFKEEEVTGDLTIHGVTKSVTLEAEVSGAVKDPWGNMRSGISLEGEIKRSDFGLKWNEVLEAGGVVVGDEVKLSIELEGIEKK